MYVYNTRSLRIVIHRFFTFRQLNTLIAEDLKPFRYSVHIEHESISLHPITCEFHYLAWSLKKFTTQAQNCTRSIEHGGCGLACPR